MENETGIIEFYYQFDHNSPGISVALSADSTLPMVLSAFTTFLLAAGFNFEGEATIVQFDDSPQDPNAELN